MSKYYTPKSEEFHIGFRYERKGRGEDWGEYVYGITPGASRNINSDLSRDRQNLEGNYRVKYLDRDDIEELFWRFIEEVKPHINSYQCVHVSQRGETVKMFHNTENNWVLIYTETIRGNQTMFAGTIKNYNQLKTLMAQLKIRG